MVDFSSYILIDEETLEKLNTTIDKTLDEKEYVPIDYSLLEISLGAMLRNARFRRNGSFPTVVRIKKEEMLGLTLDFFKSIDETLYEEAVNTIIKKHNNIKVNIYSTHAPENHRRVNEWGMFDYTSNGSVFSKRGKATVNVPTGTYFREDESKKLGQDTCTLEDLYTLVHEIAHLFDLDFESGQSITRELLGECTAIAFEDMLTEYLLKNTTYPTSKIREITIERTNSSLIDASIAYAELILAREKTKSGRVTREYIEDFVRKNNFSPQFAKDMIRQITNDPMGMMYRKRYALARLIAPTITKCTRKGRSTGIKKIFKSSQK